VGINSAGLEKHLMESAGYTRGPSWPANPERTIAKIRTREITTIPKKKIAARAVVNRWQQVPRSLAFVDAAAYAKMLA
jgi:hypothetical protein